MSSFRAGSGWIGKEVSKKSFAPSFSRVGERGSCSSGPVNGVKIEYYEKMAKLSPEVKLGIKVQAADISVLSFKPIKTASQCPLPYKKSTSYIFWR